MGELILCKNPIAARSYYLEEASLNIYSLEELSYYIHTNAFVLGDNIINETLCDWIVEELGETMLGNELRAFLNNNASQNVLVGHLLRHSGYLTRDEIKRTIDVISSFEGKTQAQIEKIRTDYLMENKRYTDAVRAYQSILDKDLEMDDKLKGDITHNLACALCGLFLFKRAIGFFEVAYRLNRNEASLQKMLFACLFDNDLGKFELLCDRYQVLPEVSNKIRESFTDTINSAHNLNFENVLKNKIKSQTSLLDKENQFKEIIDGYTADYMALRT